MLLLIIVVEWYILIRVQTPPTPLESVTPGFPSVVYFFCVICRLAYKSGVYPAHTEGYPRHQKEQIENRSNPTYQGNQNGHIEDTFSNNSKTNLQDKIPTSNGTIIKKVIKSPNLENHIAFQHSPRFLFYYKNPIFCSSHVDKQTTWHCLGQEKQIPMTILIYFSKVVQMVFDWVLRNPLC